MYKKGDYVMKIPEGVCQIKEIGCLDVSFAGKDTQYYTLVPIKEPSSRLYIPVDTAEERMRNVLSKEDAMNFIKSIPTIDEKDITDEKMLEQEYKSAILSGNSQKIVSIIKLIYARRQERIKQGKKATAIDNKYFKQAETVLFSELSFVLNIPIENMEQFIAENIKS